MNVELNLLVSMFIAIVQNSIYMIGRAALRNSTKCYRSKYNLVCISGFLTGIISLGIYILIDYFQRKAWLLNFTDPLYIFKLFAELLIIDVSAFLPSLHLFSYLYRLREGYFWDYYILDQILSIGFGMFTFLYIILSVQYIITMNSLLYIFVFGISIIYSLCSLVLQLIASPGIYNHLPIKHESNSVGLVPSTVTKKPIYNPAPDTSQENVVP